MSIFDYTKNLILFNSYEIKLIQMMIEELDLKSKNEFNFLNEISLDEIEFFWYLDSSEDNLGGFYYFSKNAIYINHCDMKNNLDNEDSYYSQSMNHIIISFGTIIHELCHYWQCKNHPILYFVLQFPFIRDYTIEKQAYKISNYLQENNKFKDLGFVDLIKMKQKYNFPKNYYDKMQKKFLNN